MEGVLRAARDLDAAPLYTGASNTDPGKAQIKCMRWMAMLNRGRPSVAWDAWEVWRGGTRLGFVHLVTWSGSPTPNFSQPTTLLLQRLPTSLSTADVVAALHQDVHCYSSASWLHDAWPTLPHCRKTRPLQ